MEQAVTKGHTVVLHLEESPEEIKLQERLFACVERMLNKLFQRYPEYRANVVFIFTSNYEPAPVVRAFCEQIFINPPNEATQARWCSRMLAKALECQVQISPNAVPCSLGDVRPLNAWWQSISHALKVQSRPSGGGVAIVEKRQDGRTCVGWKAAGDNTVAKMEPLECSNGGFFHYSTKQLESSEALDALLGKDQALKVMTVLAMSLSGTLTPAVIVLSGLHDERRATALKEMVRQLVALARDRSVRQAEVELLDLQDECKVLGNPSEIRGGLLKFIDDATNPKIKRTKQNETDVALVVAKVNAFGSLLLRELLEAGDKSRTHRLGVSKTGLVFFIDLVDQVLTPQLESRANLIISF